MEAFEYIGSVFSDSPDGCPVGLCSNILNLYVLQGMICHNAGRWNVLLFFSWE
jgi:hypothetical protein